jgi:hypothetical protein
MRMFQAACPASQRPAARPTRGSGLGAVVETIGVTAQASPQAAEAEEFGRAAGVAPVATTCTRPLEASSVSSGSAVLRLLSRNERREKQ